MEKSQESDGDFGVVERFGLDSRLLKPGDFETRRSRLFNPHTQVWVKH